MKAVTQSPLSLSLKVYLTEFRCMWLCLDHTCQHLLLNSFTATTFIAGISVIMAFD
jgi:hypothetical protein